MKKKTLVIIAVMTFFVCSYGITSYFFDNMDRKIETQEQAVSILIDTPVNSVTCVTTTKPYVTKKNSTTSTQNIVTTVPVTTGIPVTSTTIKKTETDNATTISAATTTAKTTTATTTKKQISQSSTTKKATLTTLTTKKTTTTATQKIEIDKNSKELINLVNSERKKAGLKELEVDKNLCNMAKTLASELTVKFSSTRPDGSKWYSIFNGTNYESFNYTSYLVAMGQPTAERVLDNWLKSENHKNTLLSSDYTHIGIGYIYDKDAENEGVYYWTLIVYS